MLFIDANVFIGYYNLRDVHHARAVGLWQEIENGKYGNYFTSDYVFNEVVGVTLRKFGKEAALSLGETILRSVAIITVEKSMLIEAWKLFVNSELSLNLVDCTNMITMKFAGAFSIATFDQEFKKVKGIKVMS